MNKYKNLLVETNRNLLPQFNLTLIHCYARDYRQDETGKFFKNQPILKPEEWLYLDETQEVLFKICRNQENVVMSIDIYEDVSDNIYTDKLSIYLAYLRYCFGNNLTEIINAHLWI